MDYSDSFSFFRKNESPQLLVECQKEWQILEFKLKDINIVGIAAYAASPLIYEKM